MNKKMYSAPETEIISVKYASHLLILSIKKDDQDNNADAKRNDFMEPTGDEKSSGLGKSNPWSGWEDDDK